MLEQLFKPKSIAVVGASSDSLKVGNIILRNITSSFSGKVYPVNNKTASIDGLTAYKSLIDIKESVDLVVIVVPRDAVPGVMKDAATIKAGAAIIITAGFKETDQHGAELEDQIMAIARESGIRVLGPNTIGLITPDVNATFAFADVKKGKAALVAQSGGLGVYMLNWAQESNVGISYFISLGNQADVDETDAFQFLSTDVETRAIFSYVEGVSSGQKFLTTLPDVIRRKPIIFLKGGMGKTGAAAVKTHTGSVAGSMDIFRAAVRTVGGIFVDNIEDMLNLAKIVLSSEPVSSDILIITNSGGHGVLTTDAIDKEGLNEIELPERVKHDLLSVMPEQSTPRNPIDLSGDANYDRYNKALGIIKDLDCTKIVIVQSLPMVSCSDVAKAMVNYRGKGVIGVTMGLDQNAASKLLDSVSIPAFIFPEDAVRSIKYMVERPNPVKKIRTAEPINQARELVKGKNYIKDFEAMQLMEIYGIRTPAYAIAENAKEAVEKSTAVGYPLVMKISPDTPVHKTDVKGVIMNVEKDTVESSFTELNYPRTIMQAQISGAEIFVGGIKDPVFGPAIVVGIGGIYMEVIKSLSYGICPVSEDEAYQMMKDSKVLGMLTSRNRDYDINGTVRAISKLSNMLIDLDIKEMDINPLIVNEKGAFAVDVRIVL
ncbi:acetate--CoA ligase family protein [Ferroplasma acidiphilum]|jgi:acetyl coenzyme A synthetase (ADP forming)-like protein|uniref:acetate--CoA ligase (ADP-forming) n=1 Tax=Ferroplasma acidiphilum TaxID=74969 RepID=A0A1V0N659_9ARCH|nr:acetate--CoA ligase [Ferroplasma acidiphilum]ARD85566.1 acyl-CoA synthetase [Ferroplasma acidiphilum]MCL4348974.1 acetate--CoA ligase family protein [Candidatus Thermoplasmatota archaeon]NOL59257.1 CoA-binding protein [Ferroplasma acidiphilum]WMT52701.1 MAG: acetate--CoA ligase family protein [Ferroplasma acidiphilum]